jgi:hypothetical protein
MIRRPALRGVAGLCMACVLGLSGCAGVPQWEKPGALRADVLARLGPPTAVHALAQGERLQYSQQPAGTQVHNLDFDGDGRLLRNEQALQPAVLARIETDRWTRADVLRLLGQPGLIERVARFEGDVWTYRFEEPGGVRRRLHVHLDPGGVVRQIVATDEDTPNDHDR